MKIRVLLVDDHALLREGIRSMFAAETDIEVIAEAGDGRTAVRLAASLAPDIVVMDLGMRQLNGTDATRQIRANPGAARVIALSMHADREHVLDMLSAGASGYVLKTSAYDELRRAVRAVAQGLVYLCPRIAEYVVQARSPAETEISPASPLATREREVLQLLAEGRSSAQIALALHISAHTVESHRRNIMRKLHLHSVAELTRYAIRERITSLDD